MESKTAVFSDLTGVGVNLEGGRGEAERISFLVIVGDLNTQMPIQKIVSLSYTVYIVVQGLVPLWIKFSACFMQGVVVIMAEHFNHHGIVLQVVNER